MALCSIHILCLHGTTKCLGYNGLSLISYTYYISMTIESCSRLLFTVFTWNTVSLRLQFIITSYVSVSGIKRCLWIEAGDFSLLGRWRILFCWIILHEYDMNDALLVTSLIYKCATISIVTIALHYKLRAGTSDCYEDEVSILAGWYFMKDVIFNVIP